MLLKKIYLTVSILKIKYLHHIQKYVLSFLSSNSFSNLFVAFVNWKWKFLYAFKWKSYL